MHMQGFSLNITAYAELNFYSRIQEEYAAKLTFNLFVLARLLLVCLTKSMVFCCFFLLLLS